MTRKTIFDLFNEQNPLKPKSQQTFETAETSNDETTLDNEPILDNKSIVETENIINNVKESEVLNNGV